MVAVSIPLVCETGKYVTHKVTRERELYCYDQNANLPANLLNSMWESIEDTSLTTQIFSSLRYSRAKDPPVPGSCSLCTMSSAIQQSLTINCLLSLHLP